MSKRNTRIYTLLLFSLFCTQLTHAYTSTGSGAWDNGSSWDTGSSPDTDGGWQGVITVSDGHEITVDGNLLINNGSWLVVYGDLVVTGDLSLASAITIMDGGRMVVLGEYNSNNGGFFTALNGGQTVFVEQVNMSGGSVLFNGNLLITSKGVYNMGDFIANNGAAATGKAVGDGPELQTEEPELYAYVQSLMGGLPVTYAYFQADAQGYFSWGTAQEENCLHFELQQSLSGQEFATVGTVQGHGTSFSPHHYQYSLPQLPVGTSYYRLKQVDTDGTAHYSPVITISTSHDGWLHQLPNPLTPALINQLQLPEGTTLQWYGIDGKTVWQQSNAYAPTATLAPGVYEVWRITDGRKTARRRMVVRD